jgi:hypothetical protein
LCFELAGIDGQLEPDVIDRRAKGYIEGSESCGKLWSADALRAQGEGAVVELDLGEPGWMFLVLLNMEWERLVEVGVSSSDRDGMLYER